MKYFEVNFDGLVGPTHNYSGLSYGNVASKKFQSQISHPKKAALQGLQKMKALADLGFKQAVLPPHARPHLPSLRALGFSGSDAEVVPKAYRTSPALLAQFSSAAAMWTANAATVAPSSDTADKKLHLTPANLYNKMHRAIEAEQTGRVLKKIFADEKFFTVHQPLLSRDEFGDEGAANHTRLCEDYGQKGLHVFVYGKSAFDAAQPQPKSFPARQAREACEALVRLHQLPQDQVVLVQQNPDMIDAGVFHNDVICVGNRRTLFYYEDAFVNTPAVIDEIELKFARLSTEPLEKIKVTAKDIPVADAVSSYLFNTQLLFGGEKTVLVAPIECEQNPRIKSYLDHLVKDAQNSIAQVLYFDLRESMQNGGGPACLRQRVVMNEDELKASHQGVYLNNDLYKKLTAWVEKHYWDDLQLNDLGDPALLESSCAALDDLTQILKLGSLYQFQR